MIAGAALALAVVRRVHRRARRCYLPEFHVTLLNYIGLDTLVALGLVLLTGVAA